MSDHWILDANGQPQKTDLMEWAAWYETADRHVAQDFPAKGVRVSTVFLGLDHNFFNEVGPPILYETMIFGGPNDQYQDRYSTREEALAGHKKALGIALGPEQV